MNEPELRFKADDGSEYPDWSHVVVHDLFTLIKDVNKSGENKNVITNSAEYGLISQRDYFDKDIAVAGNTNKYTVIKQGDFVYNPRKSQSAPYGPFNCYTKTQEGIVSPLYFGLRPKHSEMSPYLKYYFASHAWHQYIYNNGAQGGARHDRVGMTNELLLNVPVSVPCLEEQQKIADLFSTLDNVIDSVQKEVDSWEQMKRGVMQKLFSQEVRFKADDGTEFPEWETYSLSDFTSRLTRKNKDKETDIPLTISSQLGLVDQREYFSKTVASQDLTGYVLLKNGEFAYNKSYSAGFDYGSIKRLDKYNQGAVSTLYICFSLSNNKMANSDFLVHFFDSNIWNKEAKKICAEGARNHGLLNVSPNDFFNMKIELPCLEEQQKIADCLSEFDLVIEKTKQKLEAYKQLKKGLMQRMFV